MEATGTTVSKNGSYNVSADGYYIKNAVTGRYIASCPRPYGTPATVENRADATVFGIFSSTNTPYDWTSLQPQAYYDLQGCKIDGQLNTPDIYIFNGKKIIVK